MRLQPAYRGQWRASDHKGIHRRKRQHRSHAHDRHGLGADVYLLDTEALLSLMSNAAVTNVTNNPEGPQRGLPRDKTSSFSSRPTCRRPTTALYVGRVVFTID